MTILDFAFARESAEYHFWCIFQFAISTLASAQKAPAAGSILTCKYAISILASTRKVPSALCAVTSIGSLFQSSLPRGKRHRDAALLRTATQFQPSLPRKSAVNVPRCGVRCAQKRHHFILTFTKTFYSHHPNSCASSYFPFVLSLAIPIFPGANPPGQPCSLPFRTAPLRFTSAFLSGACAAKKLLTRRQSACISGRE